MLVAEISGRYKKWVAMTSSAPLSRCDCSLATADGESLSQICNRTRSHIDGSCMGKCSVSFHTGAYV